LESIALRSRAIQILLLKTHEQAIERLLSRAPAIRSATIVGGGMYPRTALLLRRLLPDAAIQIVDADAAPLEAAKPFLDSCIELRHERYIPGQRIDSDMVVIPLSFSGTREQVYRNPPAAVTLVHDWIWA